MLVQVPLGQRASVYDVCVCLEVPVLGCSRLVGSFCLSAFDMLGRFMGRLLESTTGVVPV